MEVGRPARGDFWTRLGGSLKDCAGMAARVATFGSFSNTNFCSAGFITMVECLVLRYDGWKVLLVACGKSFGFVMLLE